MWRAAVPALTVMLTACGGEPDPVAANAEAAPELPGVYVARLPDDDVTFALTFDGTSVRSYACGGDSNYASHSRWFCGEPNLLSASPTIRITRDDWVLEADFVGGAAVGVIYRHEAMGVADAPRIEFSAHKVSAGTRAALYADGDLDDCATGFIVLHDEPDDEPEYVGTWCEEGIYAQVTPVKPVNWALTSLPVVALTRAGEKIVYVTPVLR